MQHFAFWFVLVCIAIGVYLYRAWGISMLEAREVALKNAINASESGATADQIVETAEKFLAFLEDTSKTQAEKAAGG